MNNRNSSSGRGSSDVRIIDDGEDIDLTDFFAITSSRSDDDNQNKISESDQSPDIDLTDFFAITSSKSDDDNQNKISESDQSPDIDLSAKNNVNIHDKEVLEVKIPCDEYPNSTNEIESQSFIHKIIESVNGFFNDKFKLHTFTTILILTTLLYCIFEIYNSFYPHHDNFVVKNAFILKNILTVFSILNVLFLSIAILTDSHSPLGYLSFKHKEIITGLLILNSLFIFRRIIDVLVNFSLFKIGTVLTFIGIKILIIAGVILALNRKLSIWYHLIYLSYLLFSFVLLKPMNLVAFFKGDYLFDN